VRKVFGRRVFEANGRKYRVELRADGLFGKRNHGRRWKRFLFLTIADAIEGQRQFEFEQ
jgi:hypothetical protein